MIGIRNTCVVALTLAGTNAHNLAASEGLRGHGGNDRETARHRSLQDARPENENARCFAHTDCEFKTGTYVNPGGDVAKWWAFVPSGAKACPAEGCPLFVAVDGTGDEFFDPPDQQMWMMQMLARGFVGVTMEYAAAGAENGQCFSDAGVLGAIVEDMVGNYGLVQKAEKIFDPKDEGSVIYQMCDGPEALANCDLGIAVQGVSQGSLILGQATDIEKRISAALLWAVGDVAQYARDFVPLPEDQVDSIERQVVDFGLSCMDTFQLPPPRMRLINGEHDAYFGRTAAGAIMQHKHMIDHFYDCGDDRDCLTRNASTVPDSYTGGMIANEGGYFIVDGGTHTSWFRTAPDCGDIECPDQAWDDSDTPSPIFENEAIYGGPAGYDWLARTARIPHTPAAGSDFDQITMELDVGHWRVWDGSATDMGFFVEWAAGNGVLGERTRVAGGGYQMSAEFSGDQVPADTIGFRLSATSWDGAFLDQVHVRTSEGGAFKGLTFGEDNGGGWCVSLDPNDTFWLVECYGDQAFRCIDFCTSSTGEVENYHFCDNYEISKCVDADEKKSASVVATE